MFRNFKLINPGKFKLCLREGRGVYVCLRGGAHLNYLINFGQAGSNPWMGCRWPAAIKIVGVPKMIQEPVI